MMYSLGRGVLYPLSHALYRPTIEGKENVPREGGVIVASNHLSFIDSFAIPLASPRQVRCPRQGGVLDRQRARRRAPEGPLRRPSASSR